MPPESAEPFSKSAQRVQISRHGVVLVISLHHPFQPRPNKRHRLVLLAAAGGGAILAGWSGPGRYWRMAASGVRHVPAWRAARSFRCEFFKAWADLSIRFGFGLKHRGEAVADCAPGPIVLMSLRPGIPWRVGLHQSPPPLCQPVSILHLPGVSVKSRQQDGAAID